ncbi:MAG TPA: VIT domain-containing protein, partial [Gemmataceae bacterium]|nr:VIT domain-containing protein [Gemmataceae bacterium]
MNPIADQNIERLLQVAYHPENPDPEFVASLQQRLLAAAHPAEPPLDPRLLRRRVILGWLMGTAVAVACAGLFLHGYRAHLKSPIETRQVQNLDDTDGWLTAKARPQPVKAETLAAGNSLKTGDKERRRVALLDGSLVFLNANTSIRVEANRQLSLEAGEIFVEVSPNPNERFLVRTPDKQVTALGTKFVVTNIGGKTGVVVTQGKVQVSGLDSVLEAGQQLLPDGKPAPAPRASSVLDWTRDLFAESPLVPANQHTGGALLAFNPNGQEAKISLRKFHLDVHIEDGFARTTIDQTYFNHEWQQLEGTFYFPLPPDASISRLAMYVNGELMEGGMAERDHARNTFETIRYARRDPALLEWVDGSTFKMRVFPLVGRQEKRIILSYTQRLPVLNGKMSYRFPLEHNLKLVDDFSIQFRVKDGTLLHWNSPSHLLKPVMDGRDVILQSDANNQKLDKDVQLELTGIAGRPPVQFSSMEYEGQRYVMLRWRPEINPSAAMAIPARDAMANPARKGGGNSDAGTNANTPALTGGVRQNSDGKHFFILFETSADRDPLLARTQIEILHTILENLEHSDTFQILSANTQCQWLSEKPLTASPENIKSAIAQLEKAHLIGALDLGQALEIITQQPRRLEDLPAGLGNQFLLHIGSAIPALGERREDALVKRIPEGVHYAGIGVGKRWSRSFMKQAAERTAGHFTQINPDEPVSWRAFEFLSALMAPRWQQLSVKDNQGRDWLLMEPSVAAGEELCAVVRQPVGEALPGLLTIKGTTSSPPGGGERGGGAFETQIELESVSRNAGYLPRTWGKLEIDRLLADDSQKNQPAITDLSKKLYVMSPFTSLLVLENEAMYKQYNIDRGRKDHWAIYPCPQKIEVVKPPAPPPPDQKPKKSADDVLATIVWRNAPPVLVWSRDLPLSYQGTQNSDVILTVTGEMGPTDGMFPLRSPAQSSSPFLKGLDINGQNAPLIPLPISSDRPELGGFYTALEYKTLRMRKDLGNQTLAVRGFVDVDGSVQRDLGGSFQLVNGTVYFIPSQADSMRIAVTYTKEIQKNERLISLSQKRKDRNRPSTVRGIPEVQLAAGSTAVRDIAGNPVFILFPPNPNMPPAPQRRDVFMANGSVRSVPYHYTANQGLGYWNANGPLDWDGDGLLMNGWMGPQTAPWGSQLSGNININLSSNSMFSMLDGTSNTIMFADRANGRYRNGNYPGFNPYLYLRPRPSDQLLTVTGEVDTEPSFALGAGSVLGSDWEKIPDPLVLGWPHSAVARIPAVSSLFYQRPAVADPDRIFHDLVQYAPGMETGWADVQAVVEAETLARAACSGRVDPQARALIERARNVGWRSFPPLPPLRGERVRVRGVERPASATALAPS